MSKTQNAAKSATAPVAAQASTAAPAPGDNTTATQPGTDTATVEIVDPFANLPTHTVGEATVLDLSGLDQSLARKYAKVVEDAAKDKLPVLRGWKHSTAMLVPGTNKGGENGFKPGSVYGTIQQIVQAAGKAGIPAYEVATELRKRQMGANKRSHYCEKLPPVGWAEGWLNSAITKAVCGVHATKRAPLLALPVAEKGTESTPAQDAKAIADQTGGESKAA